jgi:hypothetical protein
MKSSPFRGASAVAILAAILLLGRAVLPTGTGTSAAPLEPPSVEATATPVEFGSQVAMQNSHAESDDELHPLRDVPRWTWPGDDA